MPQPHYICVQLLLCLATSAHAATADYSGQKGIYHRLGLLYSVLIKNTNISMLKVAGSLWAEARLNRLCS